MDNQVKVALIGAGFIADIHLQALRGLRHVQITGICDVDRDKAREAARKWGVEGVFDDLDAMLDQTHPDVAHVLIPPPLHYEIGKHLLERGVGVFMEKPLALTSEHCRELVALARERGLPLGVNHNNVYHPQFRKVLHAVESHRIGGIQHVEMVVNTPLRQLIAGDFSHWMFREPKNIVFEQAVHPFSQILALLGPPRSVHARPAGKRELIPGCLDFYDNWSIDLDCQKGSAHLFFSPGKEFPESYIHVIGQDGSVRVDLLNNLFMLHEKSRWLEFFDIFLSGFLNCARLLKGSLRNLTDYPLSLLHLRGRSDVFYLGMKGSIDAFHRAVRAGARVPQSGEEGLHVIECCEQATASVASVPTNLTPPPAPDHPPEEDDCLVIGATGFIGRHLVKRLVESGRKVRVLARRPELVPMECRGSQVRVVRGDMGNADSIRQAVQGVKAVFHLATGNLASLEIARATMLEGVKTVASACRENGVERLTFTSTIAVYDLSGSTPIIESTPLDAKEAERPVYSRVKIECERHLEAFAKESGIATLVFRPAIVVGKGGLDQHSGVGLWNRDGQCIGWGTGKNPLPFVLVTDVADALVKGLDVDVSGYRSYNLSGDVCPNAREYIEALSEATGRRLRFYGRPLWLSQAMEIGKWVVKKISGRRDAPFPSFHDLKSRTNRAPFDCRAAKEDLGWTPVDDPHAFARLAYDVHRRTYGEPAPSEKVTSPRTPAGCSSGS